MMRAHFYGGVLASVHEGLDSILSTENIPKATTSKQEGKLVSYRSMKLCFPLRDRRTG